MIRQGIISHDHHVVQVPGSGVDIEHFRHQPMCEGPLHFLMIARLMRDKGVMEYVEAARMLKHIYRAPALIRWAGRDTDTPTGSPKRKAKGWPPNKNA